MAVWGPQGVPEGGLVGLGSLGLQRAVWGFGGLQFVLWGGPDVSSGSQGHRHTEGSAFFAAPDALVLAQ